MNISQYQSVSGREQRLQRTSILKAGVFVLVLVHVTVVFYFLSSVTIEQQDDRTPHGSFREVH